MSEQQGTPTEHVSMGDNGVIMLSEEAQAVMEGIEAPQLDEPIQEATPAITEPPKVEARKIKHNGVEVEVSPDREIELLQKGYDYDFKKQQIEAERAKLQAYSGLVSAIEASPEIKAKVSQALGYQAAQPSVNEQPSFDDPIDQLKWEIRQEVLQEVKQMAKPLEQQLQMQQQMTVLDRVRAEVQKDPQFGDVQAAIIEQIKAMPESIGRNLYLQLDQDPKAYMEMFQTVKQRLAKPQPQTQATGLPEPTKRETKAPILEQGNNAESITAEQKKMDDRIKDLQRKSKNGDYRATGELMALLA